MKLTTLLKVAATTTLISTAAAHAAGDLDFNATYVLNADGKKGVATRTLSHHKNDYHYTVSAKAALIAKLNQKSNFTVINDVITPKTATMSVKFAGIGNTHDVRFIGKTVVSTYKDKSASLQMNGQAYDDLSLETKIRQELMNNKFTGSYNLVKKDSIEKTKFKKAGASKLTVPAGTYDVVRIDRIHEDKDRATSFYLAPSLNYLPIKVSQKNDGKVIMMELTKIN
ncbi:DUF3108 domain-containing protein [Moraxella nasovis]|uniref:DUF3108 domain-containing protein n=1 Tax=Moraxella nasovis TaxID=2904121 RepID=UPI001F6070FB|nr:DUF3108 domain-containing protein [Moraxella nasovis]UNU72835.1 DUF3108 domain-containing protein [Moraxella nasovis]